MKMTTRNLNKLVQSPHIAPNATYVRHSHADLRRVLALTGTAAASAELIRRIDDDMHYGEKDISQMWLWASARVTSIERFVTAVLASDAPGFKCDLDDYGRILKLTENPLGSFYYDTAVMSAKLPQPGMDQTLDDYRVPLSVQIFFEVYERHALGQYGPQYFKPHPAHRTPDNKQYLWQKFNELIDMIRAEAVAHGLKKREIANTFRSTRNFNRMMQIVNQCFAKRRRIFVICQDTFYLPEWAEKVSVDLAKNHHAIFVNRLRGRAATKKGLIGAIWMLDWAESKGHYFRWVFLFDGDDVQGAREYEEHVRDLWKKVVPKDAGEALVLNDKEPMKACTGMIDMDENPEKFEIFVESVIHYLAHKDQVLSIKREQGMRTWDSLMPGN